MTYVFKIDGMPKDTTYNGLPFGRQIEHRHAIEAFKARATSVHFSAKHKSTRAAFREFKNLYRPAQWFLIDRDEYMYHDDSFQVWYTE
jgi:hypothetical protein